MKSKNDICFLILSREDSTRVENKAFRSFGDTSLFDIGVGKFINSELIPNNQIYLSIHGNNLLSKANAYKKNGVNVHKRTDSSVLEGADIKEIYEVYKGLKYKYFVEINICSFNLSIKTINEFIEKYLSSECNGLFGVTERKSYFWDHEMNFMSNSNQKYMDTKHALKFYESSDSLYAGRFCDIDKNIHMGSFLSKNDPCLFIVPEEESIDIDYPWEFDMAEAYYKKLKHEECINMWSGG